MIHLHHHDRDIEDPWLRARLAMLPAGAAILDVGCVDGWALDEYPGALGVDSRMAPLKWVERVDKCDAETMPHAGASFDAVVSVSTLEHVGLGWYGDPEGDVEKPGRVIAEMARVLKPGGWMLLTVPIGLKMTKDGKPFARPILPMALTDWIEATGLEIHEMLIVETRLWTEAPDDRPGPRWGALISAQKPEAA